MIRWYQKTSKKEPNNQFMDLINALNDSKKEEMSQRLMQYFKDYPSSSSSNIIDEAVKWIEQNYGLSKIDRIKTGAEFLQTIRRQDEKDMADFK